MRRTKRVEITVETTRLVVRIGAGEAPVWCARCSAQARTATPAEAAALAGVGTDTIYRWAGAGRLHLVETTQSSHLICLNSLLVSTAEGGDEAPEHVEVHRSLRSP